MPHPTEVQRGHAVDDTAGACLSNLEVAGQVIIAHNAIINRLDTVCILVTLGVLAIDCDLCVRVLPPHGSDTGYTFCRYYMRREMFKTRLGDRYNYPDHNHIQQL